MTAGPDQGLSGTQRAIVGRFSDVRILVVGDAILDVWIAGTTSGVSREAPVPAVDVLVRDHVPGGAANTAVNAAALGGSVQFAGVVGRDEHGGLLGAAMQAAGTGTSGLLSLPGRPTRTKSRLLAGHHVVARFDDGASGPLPAVDDAALADRVEDLAAAADVVVVADYGQGTLDGPAVRRCLEVVGRDRPLLVDAHQPARWRSVRPWLITPNWQEVAPLLGAGVGSSRPALVAAAERRVLQRCGARRAVVTLDEDGAVLLGEGLPAPVHLEAAPVAEPHPAGAGDTFAAALALAVGAGANLLDAAGIAVAAGTVVAARPRTAVCSAADLLGGGVVPTPEALAARVGEHRRAGRRIAFTNGCFDVLHAGHIACLSAARSAADVLVVGLNDDAGVAAMKGPGRPVNPLVDRAAVLAGLGGIDAVVAFAEPAPLGLIAALRPDVYVKGADHDVAALPESRLVRSLGGVVRTVPLLPERSTTRVIAACAAASGGR
jgi:rfaE bifunctional protein kinase chain/domain/rfaE bifunctional protein nucleotidyltransferase chain/domain